MRVRVLADGIYNGPRHKSLGHVAVGSVIEVEPAYGVGLIEAGLAEAWSPEVEEVPVESTEVKPKPKRRGRRRKKAE